jgi:branched-chain amino acid transport system substrate-binding protein
VYIQAVENDLCAANINREEAAMGNPTIWARSHGLTRRAVLAAASSIAGAGVLARSRIAVAEPGKPIKIGAAMPLTGRYSREAMYCVEGYKLWAKHINEMGYSQGNEHLPDKAPGLIKGRKVELTILDDTSDPTTGARLMTHLIHTEKVDLLLGAYASSINMATRPIIEGAQIPTVSASASSQDIWLGQNLKWMVQLMTPSRARFSGIEVACQQAGFKKIALLYVDDAMPIAAATGVRKRLLEAGLELVLYEAYPVGIKDMVSLVRKARDSGAEVLAGGGYTDDGILMAKAALSLRWAPKAIWHMSDFGYPDFKKALGQNAAWHCGDTEWLPTANWPGNKAFVEAFRSEYGKEPEWLAAAGYGGCQILEEAVKRAGSVEDRTAIRDVMFSLERDTVFAHYKVAPLNSPDAGLQIGAARVGMQYQIENGELVNKVIYPNNIATGKFVYPFKWESV